MIISELIEKIESEKCIKKFILQNKYLRIEILNYGGIIKSIKMPDRDGNWEEIVLGYEKFQGYKENSAYFGCITGRIAGRISSGEFILGNKKYFLEKNNGENHIHGGSDGLNKRVWDSETIEEEEKKRVKLSYTSENLDQGYPGKIRVEVTYTLEKNILSVDYLGVPGEINYINLTNHTYFNLSGENKEDIKNHKLYLRASKYVSVDKNGLPVSVKNAEGSPLDFRKGKVIGESLGNSHGDIAIVGGGLDHPFIIDKSDVGIEYVCKLQNESNGRTVEVYSDQPVAVIYSGNYLQTIGEFRNSKENSQYLGIAIEMQDYTDIFKSFPEKLNYVTEDNPYKQHTEYRFIVN